MFLNEITTSDDRKIQKINQVLKETYGFTLVSEIKTGTLNTLYTQIANDLYDLKLDLSTVKDSAYMQKVLVLEGLKILIAKNNKRLEEAAVLAGKGGRAFTRILGELTKFVNKVCNMGDEYEEAIKDAMKHYRSSIYRFPDEVVEYELRKTTVDDCTDTVIDEMMYEAADCDKCEKCDCDPCECDKIEEAKWDYPKSMKGKGAAYKEVGGSKGVKNRKSRKAFRKAQRAEAHATRMRGEVDEEANKSVGHVLPQEIWWENDPEELMSFIYHQKRQLPPSGEAWTLSWNNIVKQLSAKFPPPADWVNPMSLDESHEDKCPRCGGNYKPGDRLWGPVKQCDKCNYEVNVSRSEVEEDGDRHAEQDWVRTMKKDAGMDTGPGYEDDTSGLSLLDPDETQDDADDFFSYRSKQMRTEMKEGYVKELRKLLEAETDQAESLIAAKSFSQELQDMVEKLGRLVNENLPAVSEQMRDAYGADVATGFEDLVAGTLNSVMDSLRTSKQEIDNSVSTIADGGSPVAGSDMENYSDEELGGEFDDAELELDGDVELDLGDEELGDEFGGDDAVAGLEDEPLGRAKKEALVVLGKKLVETKAKLARIKARK